MASDTDPFNASERGEQEPLLGASQRPLLEDERPVSPKPQHEEATRDQSAWKRSAWKIVWAVLAIFVLAIFIKGWIDAKDTDVRGFP